MQAAKRREFAFVSHPLKDKGFLRRIIVWSGAGPTKQPRRPYELDLAKAFEEGQAETADALVQAVMQAPLRRVSKRWARIFSADSIHGKYFGAPRRLLAPAEVGQGLSRIFDALARNEEEFDAEDVWQQVLAGPEPRPAWQQMLARPEPSDDGSFARLSIFAWESRPAREELFARAAAGLEFYSTASEFANTPRDGSERHVIHGLRRGFADALVQREWFVDVESCKADGNSAIRFARELMPPGSLVASPEASSDRFGRVTYELHEADRTRHAIRVVPFAYSVAELAEEVAWARDMDDREYVPFGGGFALTAKGTLPALAHRVVDNGSSGAARLLDRAAEHDELAAENLREEAWDTTLPVAALEANSCALRAKAAACRRASMVPTLYALCTLRALVAARRAEAPASGGALFQPGLPTELFRRICLMIGDGGAPAREPGPVAVLDRLMVSLKEVDCSSTSWFDPRGEDSDEESDPYGYAPKYHVVVPLVELSFTVGGEALRIKGRLSGFETFATYGMDYDDDQYRPVNKFSLEWKLQWTGPRHDRRRNTLKDNAMPKQIDRENRRFE